MKRFLIPAVLVLCPVVAIAAKSAAPAPIPTPAVQPADVPPDTAAPPPLDPSWLPEKGKKYDFKAHPFPWAKDNSKHGWLDTLIGKAHAADYYTACTSHTYPLDAYGDTYTTTNCPLTGFTSYEANYPNGPNSQTWGNDSDHGSWYRYWAGASATTYSNVNAYWSDHDQEVVYPNIP